MVSEPKTLQPIASVYFTYYSAKTNAMGGIDRKI